MTTMRMRMATNRKERIPDHLKDVILRSRIQVARQKERLTAESISAEADLKKIVSNINYLRTQEERGIHDTLL